MLGRKTKPIKRSKVPGLTGKMTLEQTLSVWMVAIGVFL